MNDHQSVYVGRCVGCGYRRDQTTLTEAVASYKGTSMKVLVCSNCDPDHWYGEWVRWWEYKYKPARWKGQVLPNWLPKVTP